MSQPQPQYKEINKENTHGQMRYQPAIRLDFGKGSLVGSSKFFIDQSIPRLYMSKDAEHSFDYDGDNLTLVGGVIRTASSGTRIEMASNALSSYDANYLRMKLDAEQLKFYDTAGLLSSWIYGGNSGANKDLFIQAIDRVVIGQTTLFGDVTFSDSFIPTVTNQHDLGTSALAWRATYTRKVQSDYDLTITADSGYIIHHSHMQPDGNNTYDIGDDANAWRTVSAYNFNDKCLYLDNEDDLGIIKNMQPLRDKKGKIILDKKTGKPKLDNKSLPEWMQVKSRAKDDKEPFRNLGHTVDLLLGAIRKLTDRIEKLEDIIDNKNK